MGFLLKKAGATYFSESSVTVNVRKSNLEFIIALEVYRDLFASKYAPIKGLAKYFYDR